jgi:hypothetical protein
MQSGQEKAEKVLNCEGFIKELQQIYHAKKKKTKNKKTKKKQKKSYISNDRGKWNHLNT